MSINEKAFAKVMESNWTYDMDGPDQRDFIEAYEAAKTDPIFTGCDDLPIEDKMALKEELDSIKSSLIDQPVGLPDVHRPVLEDIIRGALESVAHCQSPIACAKAVTKVLTALPMRESGERKAFAELIVRELRQRISYLVCNEPLRDNSDFYEAIKLVKSLSEIEGQE